MTTDNDAVGHASKEETTLTMETSSSADDGCGDDGATTIAPTDEDYAELYQKHLDGFVDEAKTLARFKHPNIVRVQDVFEANNSAYIIMDFDEGDSLERVLKKARWVLKRRCSASCTPRWTPWKRSMRRGSSIATSSQTTSSCGRTAPVNSGRA